MMVIDESIHFDFYLILHCVLVATPNLPLPSQRYINIKKFGTFANGDSILPPV